LDIIRTVARKKTKEPPRTWYTALRIMNFFSLPKCKREVVLPFFVTKLLFNSLLVSFRL